MEATMTKLSRQTRARVQKLAENKGVSISAAVRDMVEHSLYRQDTSKALTTIITKQQGLADRLAALEARLDDLSRLNEIFFRARSALIAVDELAKHILDGKHQKYAEWLAAVNRRVNEQPKTEEILRNQPTPSTAQVQTGSEISFQNYKKERAAEDAVKLKKV